MTDEIDNGYTMRSPKDWGVITGVLLMCNKGRFKYIDIIEKKDVIEL